MSPQRGDRMKEQKNPTEQSDAFSGPAAESSSDKEQPSKLGPEVDTFVDELVKIGQSSDFVSDPGGMFDGNGCHKRVREIGMQLYKRGGTHLMQAVWYRVTAVLGQERGRSLEIAWGFIGDWWP